MRNINLIFEDKEWNFLFKLKGKRTWREFILELARKEQSNE